ncbi:hypothetical protein DWF04_016910 [Cereibacter sphaeroides f. sp. denitrificans]
MAEGAGKSANLNLKITEDERWAFKAWCAQHRMSQVDAFRKAFALLKDETAAQSQNDE